MEGNISAEAQFNNPEALNPGFEIAITTGTFYPNWYPGAVQGEITADKLRGDLALESVAAAKKLGYQMAVVDGGSASSFVDALKLTGVAVDKQKEEGGQGPARRQGLEMAEGMKGVKVICTTEPEKVSIIADCVALCAAPILKGEADIVIPNRGPKSADTYPAHQAKQEAKSNKIYNKILRSRGLIKKEDPDLDFWGGTRVFANKPEINELFKVKRDFTPNKSALHSKVRMDMYSNPLFQPVVDALYKKLRVKSVDVPYIHPAQQTYLESGVKEFDMKRNVQRRTIVTELLHLIRHKEGNKNTRIVEKEKAA